MNYKSKRNYIVIGIVVAVIIVASGIWFFNRPKVLGNINQAYTEPETSTSDISFFGDAGDKIKFYFASNIENGELDITIYDSKGNIVKELDRAKELVDYLFLENSDTYTLEADCVEFVGEFKISVYEAD